MTEVQISSKKRESLLLIVAKVLKCTHVYVVSFNLLAYNLYALEIRQEFVL